MITTRFVISLFAASNIADGKQYFAPDYELDVRPSNMDNANTKDYLDKIRAQVVENLKRTAFAPSVQMTDVPRDPLVDGMDDEADATLDDLDEDENKDKRYTKRRFDQYIEKPGELSDSEDEEENAANGVRRQPSALHRRNQINYRGIDVADSGIESGLATPHDPSSVADDDIDMTGDTRMGEAPGPDTGSPSAAEPESRAEEASAAEPTEVTMERQGQPDSAAISRQPSPKAQEDTTMEDAQAPAPERPEQKETGQAEPAGKAQQPEETGSPEQPERTEAPASEAAREESRPAEQPDLPETTAEPPSHPEPQAVAQDISDHDSLESPSTSPGPLKQEPAPEETKQEPPKESASDKPEEPTKQE